MDEIEGTIGMKFTTKDVTNFQSRVAKPFFMLLKENINSRFSSQDVVSSFSVLDPKKLPNDYSTYVDESIKTLLQHYGRELPAESVLGEKFVMPA